MEVVLPAVNETASLTVIKDCPSKDCVFSFEIMTPRFLYLNQFICQKYSEYKED